MQKAKNNINPEDKPQIDKESIMEYWITMSDTDFDTMNDLFQIKRYNWALFIGHLVIEKLLKACFVKNHAQHPPLIHDLLKLALKSNLPLSEEQKLVLDTATTFNINARYDDYKLAFYKKCTKEYTRQWIEKITDLRQWIKEEHLK
jgi:HEPN domain-containing protein